MKGDMALIHKLFMFSCIRNMVAPVIRPYLRQTDLIKKSDISIPYATVKIQFLTSQKKKSTKKNNNYFLRKIHERFYQNVMRRELLQKDS